MRSELDTWQGVANVRARCEAQAVEEGLAGLELLFRSQTLFMEAINAQPTYRERQAAWYAKQKPAPNPILDALRSIAEGHNDPRRLATEVLKQFDNGEPSSV